MTLEISKRVMYAAMNEVTASGDWGVVVFLTGKDVTVALSSSEELGGVASSVGHLFLGDFYMTKSREVRS